MNRELAVIGNTGRGPELPVLIAGAGDTPPATTQAARRVALIGHSCAGKTTCLERLGFDPAIADMDKALGLRACNPGADALKALGKALRWLAARDTPMVVTVSTVEEMLKLMKDGKMSGKHSEEFGRVVLVYLHHPLNEIREHLRERRDAEAVGYTIRSYDLFHGLYTQLADRTVECAGKSAETVAAEVRDILSYLAGESV
jgi:shikimate kinase